MDFPPMGAVMIDDNESNNISSERPVIIASNRGPVSLKLKESGEIMMQRGSGGLVSALSGLARQIDATWIACAQTEEDTHWQAGEVTLTEGGNKIKVKFISPDEETYDGYYNEISNPLLWFLQHSMWDVPRAPIINKQTWKAWEQGYLPVNRLFAREIAAQVEQSGVENLIMLQDYLQEINPKPRPTILHFVHIPWPGPEYWGILPPTMRQAILDGLCGVDLLGFQTRGDSLNFIRTIETYLPTASVKYKRGRVWYRNHATHVRDFPISIDIEALQSRADSREVSEYFDEINNLVADKKLILRIDRIEPSKNIVRGFKAFEEMLEIYPEYRNKVIFLALLVPSRMDVGEYQLYLDELMAAAGQVNARYGDEEWEPIRLLVGENYSRAVAALQQYDVLLVNAIADGMNLVAKEGPMVNRKNGVLILSERAGARQQLESGSIIISPCDVYATANAMHQAITMEPEVKEEWSNRLRWLIQQEDIDAWLHHQFEEIEALNL
jgi:trehalose 6-phosphate synthase